MKAYTLYVTNTGKLRRSNQDALLVGGTLVSGVSMNKPNLIEFCLDKQRLFAVADGVGGLPCGETASKLTLEYLRNSEANSASEIKELLTRAKGFLDLFVETQVRCRGMGTALAGVFLKDCKGLAFNVGDCRVYMKREKLVMLTRDHTRAFELYERGLIKEEDINRTPLRNELTSVIMGGYPESFTVFTVSFELREGDTLLICSDGLWDELDQSYMEEALGEELNLCGRKLLGKALERGRDNISFIVLRLGKK